jgi:hypothetical protein
LLFRLWQLVVSYVAVDNTRKFSAHFNLIFVKIMREIMSEMLAVAYEVTDCHEREGHNGLKM